MSAETAVALRPSGRLQIDDDQDFWSPEQVAALKVLGIKDATNGDLSVFFHYCRRTMLDPFSRQIYMIPRRELQRWQDDQGRWQEAWVPKQTIQVGIDGFRVIRDRVAERTNCEVEFEPTTWFDAAGDEFQVWLRDDAPTACRVVLVKHSNETGRALRYPAVLRMASYIQVNKNGHPVSQWKSQPEHMIEKCCEAFATRRAFPNDFSGVYIEEEMGDRNGQMIATRAGEATLARRVSAADIIGQVEPEDDQGGERAEEGGDSPEAATAQQVNDQFRRLGFSAQDQAEVLRSAVILAERDENAEPVSSLGEFEPSELGRVRQLLADLSDRAEVTALVEAYESHHADAGTAES